MFALGKRAARFLQVTRGTPDPLPPAAEPLAVAAAHHPGSNKYDLGSVCAGVQSQEQGDHMYLQGSYRLGTATATPVKCVFVL